MRRARPVVDTQRRRRCANFMMKQHGEEASNQAAMRADELLAAGETNGYAVWKHLFQAVHELQRNYVRDGEHRH